MKIVYASRTGNVESIVSKLNASNPLKIQTGRESINEDFVIITYTIGHGETPKEVQEFLKNNSQHLKGVISSGSMERHADTFCFACDNINKEYNAPCLYKVDGAGTDTDIKNIQDALTTLK